MRRRHLLVTLGAATTTTVSLAGCLDDSGSGGNPAASDQPSSSTTYRVAPSSTTAACAAGYSILELREPPYADSLGETPPVSSDSVTEAERDAIEAAVSSESYKVCGNSKPLASLASQLEKRHETRWDEHRARWTEQGMTVEPPQYLARYYLEHDDKTYLVRIVLAGETVVPIPG
ncbi:hypothetical protein [Haloarchaeobius sp. DFWS5]|uniref:hypothetical protein n=1 Tax=Haloarchaeobius sp. DFWS5 TaxID=3446114 RepID=UPI003EBAE7B1